MDWSTRYQPAERGSGNNTRWAIVVAHDHGPEWAPQGTLGQARSPVQYGRLGGSATLMQKALHRAAKIAPASRLLVTVREGYRVEWEGGLWFLKADHRFVCSDARSSWLTTASALLRVANDSPSSVVVILPARCFVANEDILSTSIQQALAVLPWIPEGIVTLGMVDIDEGADEDYLVPKKRNSGLTRQLLGVARSPVSWAARHLRQHGALVASEVMVGYVGAFAAHISHRLPGITAQLIRLTAAAAVAGTETTVNWALWDGMATRMLRSLRWYPPSLPQRALSVYHCGWSSLRSARAVARITGFVDSSATSEQWHECAREQSETGDNRDRAL